MSLNIKSERVHKLAKELAAIKGESMTSVILRALENERTRVISQEEEMERRNRAEARKQLDAFWATKPDMPADMSSDHSDLYDDNGFPA